MRDVQTYDHNDGLFKFEAPSAWTHTTENDGTQVLWDSSVGSGTLRVTSLTGMKRVPADSLPQLSTFTGQGQPTMRADGVAWLHYVRKAEENGQPISVYCWKLANFVAPCFLRLALFSFTIYTRETCEPGTASQLQLLRVLLPRTQFGPLQEFERAQGDA